MTRRAASDSLPVREKTDMANDSELSAVSRRDFARKVAAVAAAAALPPALVGQADPGPGKRQNAPSAASSSGVAQSGSVDVPKEVAAEVSMKFEAILRLSAPGGAGSLTAEQKDEIRRQLVSQVQGLQKLRAYALDNGDAPATVLRLTTVGLTANAPIPGAVATEGM